jgi:hypothetical protein
LKIPRGKPRGMHSVRWLTGIPLPVLRAVHFFGIKRCLPMTSHLALRLPVHSVASDLSGLASPRQESGLPSQNIGADREDQEG